MSYIQMHGTPEMNRFTGKVQGKLRTLITEAWVWNGAHDNAMMERRSDQQVDNAQYRTRRAARLVGASP